MQIKHVERPIVECTYEQLETITVQLKTKTFKQIMLNEHNSIRSFSSLKHIHFDVN